MRQARHLGLISEHLSNLRLVSILKISKLRFVDSDIPGNSLWARKFHPLEFQFLLESDPLKSRVLVRQIGRSPIFHRPRREDWRPTWSPSTRC